MIYSTIINKTCTTTTIIITNVLTTYRYSPHRSLHPTCALTSFQPLLQRGTRRSIPTGVPAPFGAGDFL